MIPTSLFMLVFKLIFALTLLCEQDLAGLFPLGRDSFLFFYLFIFFFFNSWFSDPLEHQVSEDFLR